MRITRRARAPDFAARGAAIEAVLRYQACDDSTCLPPAGVREVLVPVGGGVPGAAAAPTAPSGAGLDGRLAGAARDPADAGADDAARPRPQPDALRLPAHLRHRRLLRRPARSRSRTAWLRCTCSASPPPSRPWASPRRSPAASSGRAAAAGGGAVHRRGDGRASLSSFGVYQLQPPASLMRWAGGSASGAAGALFMGLTMGVVAAPCVGPIVVGLLVFVGSRQDAGLGFALFFFLALGMGLPYLVLAVAAGSITACRAPASGWRGRSTSSADAVPGRLLRGAAAAGRMPPGPAGAVAARRHLPRGPRPRRPRPARLPACSAASAGGGAGDLACCAARPKPTAGRRSPRSIDTARQRRPAGAARVRRRVVHPVPRDGSHHLRPSRSGAEADRFRMVKADITEETDDDRGSPRRTA